MTIECSTIRERLADLDTPVSSAPAEIQEHLAGCAACREVLRSLEEVDAGLRAFAPLEPPAALVARTMAKVQEIAAAQAQDAVAPAAAAQQPVGILAVLTAILGGVFRGLAAILGLLFRPILALGRRKATQPDRPATSRPSKRWVTMPVGAALAAVAVMVGFASWQVLGVAVKSKTQSANRAMDGLDGLADDRGGYRERRLEEEADNEQGNTRSATAALAGQPAQAPSAGPVGDPNLARSGATDREGDTRSTILNIEDMPSFLRGEQRITTATGTSTQTDEQAAAANFGQRYWNEGWAVQEPRGYWANTYIPGDPVLTMLHGRLVRDRATTFGPHALSGLALAEQAEPNQQPFDSPTRAAVGLFVHADRTATQGRSRLLLQVGMRGSSHTSARRPALRIAIVLDLRAPLTDTQWAEVRGLLEASGRVRDTEDRIGLVVAGPQGGVAIAPGGFRYGEVTVALQHLRAPQAPAGSTPRDLEAAMRAAMASLATPNDPNAPAGSGLVWVVTPGLTASDAAVQNVAHVGALAGISTSVIAIGDGGETSAMDGLVLAGQGRRRHIADASTDAERVVRDEIAMGGRIVGRALRLRIRLAPGVQLVDIIGSHRLDDASAARVREAEQAADLQLARDLGILQDRGADEDGIQIVIPAFYADDAHVVLLDLVVPGPGPVADVSLRYKDLVRLRNSSANESFSLERGERARGPLERSVVANFVAHQVARALTQAGERMDHNDPVGAIAALRAFIAQMPALRSAYPDLGADPRVEADVALGQRYMQALQGASAGPDASTLADSLHYAGRRRLVRPVLVASP